MDTFARSDLIYLLISVILWVVIAFVLACHGAYIILFCVLYVCVCIFYTCVCLCVLQCGRMALLSAAS